MRAILFITQGVFSGSSQIKKIEESKSKEEEERKKRKPSSKDVYIKIVFISLTFSLHFLCAYEAHALAGVLFALQIFTNEDPLREAPPTRKPSTSTSVASSSQLASLTDPP